DVFTRNPSSGRCTWSTTGSLRRWEYPRWASRPHEESHMLTVRQLLEAKTPEVFSVAPDAPVIDAIRLMAEKRVGAVLVMEGARLAGILSERDYARKIVLEGRSSK